uniref:Crystallin beta-gamma domain containing 2 n=1 Tax=Pseudonaja textilis TaxID=8673 RepID=A0A670YG85_PSETE
FSQALIFERPHFQGHSWEFPSFPLFYCSSIVISSWVGYEKEGFRGHQYLLEEGEYCDWTDWAGYNEDLLSLRLIRTVSLYLSEILQGRGVKLNFIEGCSRTLLKDNRGVELIPHQNTILQLVHEYGAGDNFISFAVTRWVAYEGKNFSGKQYILEKGVYRNCEDWGANSCQISSVQPVLQVRIC